MERVLIIDDSTEIVELLSAFLQKTFAVIKSYSAEEAISFLSQDNQDNLVLIITDIKMQGMTGIEFIKKVRQDLNCLVPIIAMTGADTGYLMDAMRFGAIDILHKPFARKELLEKIQEVLRKTEEE